jgi:ABC-type transporter Mla subunit MlaD
MAGIDANLDDVQAGAEATSRAADTLIGDTGQFNGLLKGALLRAVARHVKELRACASDQRAALSELRKSLAGLRHDLRLAQREAIRPPSLATVDSKPR